MAELEALCWPLSHIKDALRYLALKLGADQKTMETQVPLINVNTNLWLARAADSFNLEAEPVNTKYLEVDRMLRSAAPAILQIPSEGNEPRFIVLIGHGHKFVSVLAPDFVTHKEPVEKIRKALCVEMEAPILKEAKQLLEISRLSSKLQDRVTKSILKERLSVAVILNCWLIRLTSGGGFWHILKSARLPQHIALLLGAHSVEYLLWILSWLVIGSAALGGRLDHGWMMAWILLLLTVVPFRLWVTWLNGKIAIQAGAVLKQRLLLGALKLEPEEIRHQGIGQFLGRVIESEAVESLALSGGLLSVIAVVELAMAGIVLHASPHSRFDVLLMIWICFSVFLGYRYYRRCVDWSNARLKITDGLVEKMVGHRTRLAQQTPNHWHDGEDEALSHYVDRSRNMDYENTILVAAVPRGWLILCVLGLASSFLSGATTIFSLSVTLGGVLLAWRAFRRLNLGLPHIARALVAWKQIAPLFRSAARSEFAGAASFLPTNQDSQSDETILSAQDLQYRYSDRNKSALTDCTLKIQKGERLLLQGLSGSGKSTLASLLTGLRQPQSGLLLLHGLDHHTVGSSRWRRRVVAAPQFHENHVLTGTFAYNLLMGRGWPPGPQDLADAETLCHKLGLGELLKRMPAGLSQMVGDTGWQLSHGERSRMYIARTLLQGAEVIILDESFASLDPENFQRSLQCVLEHAPTLVVIAHP